MAGRISAGRRPAGRAGRALLVLGGFLALAGCGADLADGAERPGEPLGPGHATITVGIEHSRFDLADDVRVVEGTTVHFQLENGDPIGHELIVGPPEVHGVHEAGTHGSHGVVAGEVSVGPGDEASTAYRFDEVGAVEFACHLRGHYAYGMHGQIEVVPAS
jgi:plastocyanin